MDVDVSLPEASTVGLLDAAVHVARLVDSSNPRLMVPAALGSVWLADGLADAHGFVEVRRCGGNGDELIVDIVVKAADGRPCIEIRALRYADVQSAPVQAARDADPLTFVHAIEWQPWRGHAEPQQPPDSVCDVAVLGQSDAASTLRARLSDAGYRAAGVDDARCVVYVAEAGPEHSGESDLDCSVRLSGEVTDLVRRLAKRDDRHNPRCGSSPAVSGRPSPMRHCAQSCLWGLAGVIGAEQPQLWGGLVDIPAVTTSVIVHRRCPRCCRRQPSPSWRCATANSSRRRWCRSPANRCESRCGVVPMRLTSSPAAWAHSVC